jgi:hypothetical protein
MNDEHFIGHRHDASLEELNDALFEATLNGHEAQIAALQEMMRQRFGNLF